jgi:hypothetical protein
MLRRVAAHNFGLSWCDGCVKACIWRRSASGIVHHGWRRVVYIGSVARDGGSIGGLLVYANQTGGRGAIASIPPAKSELGVGIRSPLPLV